MVPMTHLSSPAHPDPMSPTGSHHVNWLALAPVPSSWCHQGLCGATQMVVAQSHVVPDATWPRQGVPGEQYLGDAHRRSCCQGLFWVLRV